MNLISKRLKTILTLGAMLACAHSQSYAETLDVLISQGQSVTVGNYVFSNFSIPSSAPMFNVTPSNFDVQGVTSVDPSTGVVKAGLRFVMVRNGVPTPLKLSPNGRKDPIVALVDYTVTGPSTELRNITHTSYDEPVGRAGLSVGSAFGEFSQILNQTAPIVGYTNWWNGVLLGAPIDSAPMTLSPIENVPFTYNIRGYLHMEISSHKGVKAGTISVRGWDTLFSE